MSNMKTLDQTAATSTLDLEKVTLGLKVKTGLKAGGDNVAGYMPMKEKKGKKKKGEGESAKPYVSEKSCGGM